MSIKVSLDILNQKGTPAFYSDVFANRPAFGFAGRVFISTDTGAIYEDTGSAWVLIADATGVVTTPNLQSVTTVGNSTTNGLVVTSGNLAIGTATAGAPLDIHATGTNAQFNGTGTNNAYLQFQNAGTNKWRIGNTYSAGANLFHIYNNSAANNALTIDSSNAATFIGNLTASSIIKSSGTSSQFLKADGSVDSNSYITLGSLSATSPVQYNNTTGVISILQAGASQSGYLTSTNWNTFNNKQGALTLTTTGTSGAATLIGNTLNIPQYSGGGMAIGGSITSATAGSVLYVGASGVLAQDNSNFYYDYTNIRIGLGTTSPQQILSINNPFSSAGTLYPIVISQNAGVELGGVYSVADAVTSPIAAGLAFKVYVQNSGLIEKLRITNAGLVGINTTTIGSQFQVNGNVALGYSTSTAAPTNGLAVSGNAGFGTNTPGYTAASRQVVAINGGSAAAQGSILAFMQAGVNKGYLFSIQNDIELWCESGEVRIGNNAASNIVLKTNNTDRLIVGSTGNIGIGTATIGSKLQVNGNAAIGYSSSTAAPTNGLAVSGKILVGTTTDNGQGTLQNTNQTFTGGLGIGGLTFSTNTTATVNTSFYFFNGGAGITLTMPDTNGQSMVYYIKNYSASALTIGRTGSNTFIAVGTIVTTTSLTLASGASATLLGNGTTNYIQLL
jgi:hypothetical protein